jgi:hypothetical protein
MDYKLFVLIVLGIGIVAILLSLVTVVNQVQDAHISILETQQIILERDIVYSDRHISLLDNIELINNKLFENQTEILNKFEKPKPTKVQVIDLFEKNKPPTSWEHDDNYNCVDYTDWYIGKLFENNVQSCRGYLETPDTAHSIVVVDTHEGLIYIEPQELDLWIIPHIFKGFDFCSYFDWLYDFDCKVTKFSNCYEGRMI